MAQLNVDIPEETRIKFKQLCVSERIDMQKQILEMINTWLKEHGDGNPVYQLDHWVENDEFMAVPALFRTEYDVAKYLQKVDRSQFEKVGHQLDMWVRIHNKYGGRFA